MRLTVSFSLIKITEIYSISIAIAVCMRLFLNTLCNELYAIHAPPSFRGLWPLFEHLNR